MQLLLQKKNSTFVSDKKRIANLINKEKESKINLTQTYKKFFKKILNEKIKLVNFLKKINQSKKMVIGYGASTKGNVILQFCNISSKLIQYICDVNKDKNNCYTPGSKIKIISESFAKKINPDYYFVLPWHFKKFIIQKENKLINRGTKFIFPLPKLRIY